MSVLVVIAVVAALGVALTQPATGDHTAATARSMPVHAPSSREVVEETHLVPSVGATSPTNASGPRTEREVALSPPSETQAALPLGIGVEAPLKASRAPLSTPTVARSSATATTTTTTTATTTTATTATTTTTTTTTGASAPQPASALSVEAPPAESKDRLAEEVALLRRIDDALRAGDGNTALQGVDEHARSYRDGALAEEREAARVLALCVLGRRDAAAQAAAGFRAHYPRSTSTGRLRASCVGASDVR